MRYVSIFLLMLFLSGNANASEPDHIGDAELIFVGRISEITRIDGDRSKAVSITRLFSGGKPFTVQDGVCFIASASMGMTETARRGRVSFFYSYRQFPSHYHVTFEPENGQWQLHVQGGGPGSAVGVRCMQFR